MLNPSCINYVRIIVLQILRTTENYSHGKIFLIGFMLYSSSVVTQWGCQYNIKLFIGNVLMSMVNESNLGVTNFFPCELVKGTKQRVVQGIACGQNGQVAFCMLCEKASIVDSSLVLVCRAIAFVPVDCTFNHLACAYVFLMLYNALMEQ